MINLSWFDWLMESIQIFLKLDSLFKAKGNVPAKTILFISNLDSWQKLIKNRSVGNIGLWCSLIITRKNRSNYHCEKFKCVSGFVYNKNCLKSSCISMRLRKNGRHPLVLKPKLDVTLSVIWSLVECVLPASCSASLEDFKIIFCFDQKTVLSNKTDLHYIYFLNN